MLSDADKRSKYDRFGAQWEQYERSGGRPEEFDWGRWSRGAPGGAGAPGGGLCAHGDAGEEFEEMSGGAGGFSSFFDTLFGGRSGGAQQPGASPATASTQVVQAVNRPAACSRSGCSGYT